MYKRRAARNLRLSINSNGKVRVSIPTWAPYKAGLEFAETRLHWIEKNKPAFDLITDNQAIGKAHHIRFRALPVSKISTRVKQNEIIINHPIETTYDNQLVQAKAKAAAIRALKVQAESLLPKRLAALAAEYEFNFNSVQIKRLTSRWGSCDQSKNIVLNLYLMQLPWHLIDYVLLHELTHTVVFKHGSDFWQAMDLVVKDSKSLRKELRSYKTTVSGMWHNTNYAV